MPRVGRRHRNPKLPAGVRERGKVWYWKPGSAKERAARRARGEKVEVKLGAAGTVEARKKWAELTGLVPAEVEGTLAELITLWETDPAGLPLQANGEPRAASTVEMYRDALPVLREKFGRCRYGKTDREAAEERALGTPLVQKWIDEHPHRAMLKRQFYALDNIFGFAIRRGRTTYNPCSEAALRAGGVREREALPWEVEVLRTLASPRMGLMMDFEAITGWRIGDILSLVRAQGTPDGVRVRYAKRGGRWLWEWTPELRRIWSEAEQLPGASKFPASPIFPSTRKGRGGPMTYGGWDGEWQRLKRRANAELRAGVIDPATLAAAPGLFIEDLHFHDLRSKAHDDAEALLGIPGHEFLGNTQAVARRHYRRREQRRRPLK